MNYIICCYGNYDSSRFQTEIEGLDEYIDQIVDYLSHKHDIENVILSGGYTTISNISESESMYEILKDKLPHINFKFETCSHYSHENIFFSLLALRKATISEICVICDTYRENKIYSILKDFLSDTDIIYTVQAFDRKDINANSSLMQQEKNILTLQGDERYISMRDFFKKYFLTS